MTLEPPISLVYPSNLTERGCPTAQEPLHQDLILVRREEELRRGGGEKRRKNQEIGPDTTVFVTPSGKP